MRTRLCTLFLLAVGITGANAQVQLSVNAGAAVPIRNDADPYNPGFHVGAAARFIAIPVQLEGSFDKMGAEVGKDITVLGGAVTLPINITPPLTPVSFYVLGGGGLYKHNLPTTATDVGLTAGAGVRFGAGALNLLAEARGVGVLAEGNKITYVTATLGVRF